MSTLDVSPRDRLIARIVFYMLVLLVMWTTNLLLPDWYSIEEQRWAELGVVPPLIGVPISEIPVSR